MIDNNFILELIYRLNKKRVANGLGEFISVKFNLDGSGYLSHESGTAGDAYYFNSLQSLMKYLQEDIL